MPARPGRRRRSGRRPRSDRCPSAVRSPRRRATGAGSWPGPTPLSSFPRADELGQLRHDLVQVADDAEVAELEDRGVRVLVDRDDRARALHAYLVLDRAGDAARDVELRRDALPGLADLS